jgi:hypothetical protein
VWGQENTDTEKSRIAVYLTASEKVDEEIKGIVNNQVINALTRTGKYEMIERNEAFVKQIDTERVTQLSGRVSDDQITELGKEYGAVTICIADIRTFMDELSVDMRIVSVEKAIVIYSGFADGSYTGISDIRKIVNRATLDMIESSSETVEETISVSHLNGEVWNPDGIELVYVEGTGSGITAVKGFYIGKYEITQAQWKAVMGNNPSGFKGDNLPVENVSWNDVQKFILKLNDRTGKKYKLPTETEWNYAARGGNKSQNYEYSGSNTINNVAWYSGNSSNSTHPVGTKQPNELEIYDMTGNVWEWCEDWYDNSQQHRVLRGGSWGYIPQSCRISSRHGKTSDDCGNGSGFRLVLIP